MDANAVRELAERISEACPTWVSGTMVFFDDERAVVGVGRLDKSSDGEVTFSVSPAPQVSALLSGPLQPSNV
jgi:hypothetical protein